MEFWSTSTSVTIAGVSDMRQVQIFADAIGGFRVGLAARTTGTSFNVPLVGGLDAFGSAITQPFAGIFGTTPLGAGQLLLDSTTDFPPVEFLINPNGSLQVYATGPDAGFPGGEANYSFAVGSDLMVLPNQASAMGGSYSSNGAGYQNFPSNGPAQFWSLTYVGQLLPGGEYFIRSTIFDSSDLTDNFSAGIGFEFVPDVSGLSAVTVHLDLNGTGTTFFMQQVNDQSTLWSVNLIAGEMRTLRWTDPTPDDFNPEIFAVRGTSTVLAWEDNNDIVLAILDKSGGGADEFLSAGGLVSAAGGNLSNDFINQLVLLKNGTVALLTSTVYDITTGALLTLSIFSQSGALLDTMTFNPGQMSAEFARMTELSDGRIAIAGPATAFDDDKLFNIIVDPRADVINGTSAGEFIYGKTTRAETINGGGGSDRLFTLSKITDGDSTLNGDAGNDFLFGADGVDVLNGGAAQDVLRGGEGKDRLDGGSGNDQLFGDGGNDNLNGGEGADTIRGGTGEDFAQGGDGVDFIFGEDGSDELHGDAGDDRLTGGEGVDLLYGGADNDRLIGENGTDYLYGEDGNDTIYGGAETDFLYGGAGDDKLYGEAGIDLMEGGAGADVLSGGSGQDTVTYINSTGTVAVDLGNPANGFGDGLGDTFFGVEIIRLSNHQDYFNGETSGTRYFVFGNDGDDAIVGTKAGGSYYGGNGNDIFQLSGTQGPGGTFSAGGCLIRGDEQGGAQGKDIVSLWLSNRGLSINMTAATTRDGTFTFLFGGQTQRAYGDVDGLFGSLFDDVFIGNTFNNSLDGFFGHDSLSGGGGADELIGNEGNDRLDGGADADNMTGGNGADTFVFASPSDIVAGEIIDGGAAAVAGEKDTIELATGDYDFRVATVTSIEAIKFPGGPGGVGLASKIIIDSSQIGSGFTANTAISKTAAGGPIALIDVRMAAAGTLDLSGFTFDGNWNGGQAAMNDRVQILGSAGVDTITGTSTADFIRGGDGNDIMIGGAGNDRLRGNTGSDSLTGGAGADQFDYISVDESPTGGNTVRDIITDFEAGIDKINVNQVDANELLVGVQSFVLDVDNIFTAGEFRIRAVGTNQIVDFNTDGDVTAEMQIGVIGINLVGASDFIL